MSSPYEPSRSVGFALKRLQLVLRSKMDATLAGHGLTSPLYGVLAVLAEHPGISNAELARRSSVAAPTMLRMVDSLSRAGLVDRAAASAELRSRGNTLTDEGRERFAAASIHVQEFELLLTRAAADHLDVVMAWLRSCADELSG